jgi:hypothetical protein
MPPCSTCACAYPLRCASTSSVRTEQS